MHMAVEDMHRRAQASAIKEIYHNQAVPRPCRKRHLPRLVSNIANSNMQMKFRRSKSNCTFRDVVDPEGEPIKESVNTIRVGGPRSDYGERREKQVYNRVTSIMVCCIVLDLSLPMHMAVEDIHRRAQASTTKKTYHNQAIPRPCRRRYLPRQVSNITGCNMQMKFPQSKSFPDVVHLHVPSHHKYY